jgi:hypothetical protein
MYLQVLRKYVAVASAHAERPNRSREQSWTIIPIPTLFDYAGFQVLPLRHDPQASGPCSTRS